MEKLLPWSSTFSKKQNEWLTKLKAFTYELFIQKKLAFFLTGLLLGRAVILYDISPFAIAFIATIWMLRGERLFTIVLFCLIGAWSYSLLQGIWLTLVLSIFGIMTLFVKKRMHVKLVMVLVFCAPLVTRLFLFSITNQLTLYHWLYMLMEASLAVVLLLIFLQSVPLFTMKPYERKIKNEELICVIILFASLLTGLVGWELYSLALEHVFSRYIVLVIAFVGGAALGSTVGVVAGLILSLANIANLYQMSLLAFSGLLGGLLKEGSKLGVSSGLILGSVLLGLYSDATSFTATMFETVLAILLFYMTPKGWLKQLAKRIPGTNEYSQEERKYVEKIRDVTAKRVEQFSEVFAALAKSFMTFDEKNLASQEETDYFLSVVTEKTCQTCFMKKRCWQNRFEETYRLMCEMKEQLVDWNSLDTPTWRRFENHCVKAKKVLDVMSDEATLLKMNKQIKKQVVESKKIVADQLQGVSEVMDHFAKEIVKERKRHESKEIEIIRALKQLDLHIEKIEIYNLEKGNVDIEIVAYFSLYLGEGAKIIAPLLSDILQETIVVHEEHISNIPHTPSTISFQSARQYTLETGVAMAAKGGELISGDSYAICDLGRGKIALAISDGMGNGVRAREESMETLRLLEQILQTGISEQVAIQSINSILALRTTDEIFATLDLAIINLHHAGLRFLKIGSAPSFIKRGTEILQLEANNIPIGIIEYVEFETVQETLEAGDLLIMMSDGVYEGAKQVKNKDIWLKRKLRQIETDVPQEVADLLLEEVIRSDHGYIHDDMTIIVAKIMKMKPKWQAIPMHYSYGS